MKYETKHIIAKEVYRFFKTFLICLIIGLVFGIATYIHLKYFDPDPTPGEIAAIVGFTFGGYSLLGVYAYRLIKAGYKWVMKWK